MKRTMKQKTMLNALLVVFFIGMTLSGCAVDDSGVGELSVGQEISSENLITANEPISESQMPSDYTEKQETATDPQNLYEQFLNNEIPVIINNDDEYANAGINLTISIYAIGNDKYYLYDIGECSEEEKARYELYINRCHDEEGINWVTEEEIQTAIQNQCNAVGIDYSITNPSKETEWNSL